MLMLFDFLMSFLGVFNACPHDNVKMHKSWDFTKNVNINKKVTIVILLQNVALYSEWYVNRFNNVTDQTEN